MNNPFSGIMSFRKTNTNVIKKFIAKLDPKRASRILDMNTNIL